MRVLVLGGTGSFGALLVEGLVRHTAFAVVIAARDRGRAEALAARLRAAHPGRDIVALALDARQATPESLRATGAFALVDAAGPWQGAGYRLPRAAIAAGMHAIDLSDARDHVAGFAAALDAPARAAGVAALAGASSTPALSHAVLDELTQGWRGVAAIEVAILPGNRAPRGLSVVWAILSYAGWPVRLFHDGAWQVRPGWGMTRRIVVPGLGRRWAGLCETPDLDLLPARFAPSRDAVFRAGLELPVLHLGLWLASLPVRAGLLASLARFARPARWLAGLLDRFGTDRGGMLVEARGVDAAGEPVRARWTLLAEAGDGPRIPTLPALAALRALAEGRIASGARPCAGVLGLAELAREFAPYRITARTERWCPAPLFADALGSAFAALPAPLRAMHGAGWHRSAAGEAEVEGAAGLLARIVARLVGFPPSGRLPVRVTMSTDGDGECWVRDFGGRRFRSRLRWRGEAGRLEERFGPFAFTLEVPAGEWGLGMRVERWRCLGVRLPRWLAPFGDATESVDAAGRFRFDVSIRLPLGLGRVVRYRGWLLPEPEAAPVPRAGGEAAAAPPALRSQASSRDTA
jgi:hypothetical protein